MHFIPSIVAALASVFFFNVGVILATGTGTVIALTISGVNALAALLTGYAAVKSIRKGKSDNPKMASDSPNSGGD